MEECPPAIKNVNVREDTSTGNLIPVCLLQGLFPDVRIGGVLSAITNAIAQVLKDSSYIL